MKKTLLSVIFLLGVVCSKAQVYVTGHITTVASTTKTHDSTYCHSVCVVNYMVTIDTAYLSDTVRVVDTLTGMLMGTFVNAGGASPWTFTMPISSSVPDYAIVPGGPYSIAFFPFSTFKIVYMTDTQYITQSDTLMVSNPCEYGDVSGDVYIDNNANCIYDAGDVGLSSYDYVINDYVSSPPAVLNYSGYAVGPAAYSSTIQKSWMTHYTVQLPSYYSFIFPTSPCFAGPYSLTTLPMTGVDFPLQCTSNIDVQCDILCHPLVRAHTPFILRPYVSNTGCDIASGQMKLVKDPHAIYDASLSTHPADFVYGDTLVWNYSGLSNISSGPYWNTFFSGVHLTPDMTISAGDTLCFRVYANIPTADINPSNQDNTICLPVVYSYDPNIKEVSPKGDGPQGYISPATSKLEYTLHFQNTGTAAAYNIYIIDTLDGDVNPSSLKILGTSHLMQPEWLAPNVIKFKFDNIFLPDSTSNEPASHGNVKFNIALNSGLAPGTQIKNKGYIYFDMNPPVITNTALNTIAIPTTVRNVSNYQIRVYPNPATDKLTIEGSPNSQVCIMGINGAIIATETMIAGKTIIDISKLPAGVYMVKTVNDANTTVTKFTKY